MAKEKKFRELSEEELKNVTGGVIDILYAGNKFTDIELRKRKKASDQCIENGQQLPNRSIPKKDLL